MQIPDMDAVLHFADFPCIPRPRDGAPPAPMLGLQGSAHHSDIPFPDYTYWGNEHQYLQVCEAVVGRDWLPALLPGLELFRMEQPCSYFSVLCPSC